MKVKLVNDGLVGEKLILLINLKKLKNFMNFYIREQKFVLKEKKIKLKLILNTVLSSYLKNDCQCNA
jgi:hypothetical protein